MTYLGDFKFSSKNNDHKEWVLCDGRILFKDDYKDLYDLLNMPPFKINDQTFRLPDCRGRVLAMNENNNVGEIIGSETHMLNNNEMPKHNHNGNTSYDGSHNHGGETSVNGLHSHSDYTKLGTEHTHKITGLQNFARYAGDISTTLAAYIGNHLTNSSSTNVNFKTIVDGEHQHNISNDHYHNHSIYNVNGHSHYFISEENDTEIEQIAHNNIQPTIYLGNVFIYSKNNV